MPLGNLGSSMRNSERKNIHLSFSPVMLSHLLRRDFEAETLNALCSLSGVQFSLDSQEVRFSLAYRSYHETWRSRGICHNHSVDLRMTGKLSAYTCFPSAVAAWQLLYTLYCAGAFFWQTCSDNRAIQSKHQ